MKRIALLADSHLSLERDSVQHDAVRWAVDQIKQMDVDGVIVAGDIAAHGEADALDAFMQMLDELPQPKAVVLGNHDTDQKDQLPRINAHVSRGDFDLCGRKIICLNTTSSKLDEHDRALLEDAPRDAIVVMHFTVVALEPESRDYLISWAEKRTALILQAHSHRMQTYYIRATKVVGLCTLDPERTVGGLPGFSILEADGDEAVVLPQHMPLDPHGLEDFRENLGISCFDPETDIDYAADHGIANIEIRSYRCDEAYAQMLHEKVCSWRKSGGKCLSLHMPNLYWDETGLRGLDEFQNAFDLAKNLGVNSLTIHVPRVQKKHMQKGSAAWLKLLDATVGVLKNAPADMAIAIENLHAGKGEKDDGLRGFGYTPGEVMAWVQALNEQLGKNRAGYLFDIGHARNNPPLYSSHTVGSWMSLLGQNIRAYHLHQVVQTGTGQKNHAAITNWFGAQVNYFAFFLAWKKNQIAHRPMFLEMRSLENCQKSLTAFNKLNI